MLNRPGCEFVSAIKLANRINTGFTSVFTLTELITFALRYTVTATPSKFLRIAIPIFAYALAGFVPAF